MALVDDGVLSLGDPVERFLPELADRRVLRSLESALDDTVPAERSITVEDLLTFRLGFGAIMAPPGAYPIQDAEAELGLMTLGPPWPPPPFGSDEWIRRFATLPLLDQPGAEWRYNTGAQVLGVLLERASGQPLEAFLRARLFEPLGMVDTSFSVPAEKQGRFTTAYMPGPRRPASWTCSTGRSAGGGASRRPWRTRRACSSRRSTTCGPSCPCCCRGAATKASSCCRRDRWRT